MAVHVGCMLSRARTGLPNSEMTCAIPASRLPEVIERLTATSDTDRTVAAYAGHNAQRFQRFGLPPSAPPGAAGIGGR